MTVQPASERTFAVLITDGDGEHIQEFTRLTSALDYAALLCRQGHDARLLAEEERVDSASRVVARLLPIASAEGDVKAFAHPAPFCAIMRECDRPFGVFRAQGAQLFGARTPKS